MYYDKKKYRLVKFERSTKPEKKYMAILKDRESRKSVKVHFGSSEHEHYRDSTGLGLWSHKNHLDKERRRRYKARHQSYLRPGYYSPGYFSMKYLW